MVRWDAGSFAEAYSSRGEICLRIQSAAIWDILVRSQSPIQDQALTVRRYHSHSAGQIIDGMYGPIYIRYNPPSMMVPEALYMHEVPNIQYSGHRRGRKTWCVWSWTILGSTIRYTAPSNRLAWWWFPTGSIKPRELYETFQRMQI